jgi:hypothetical protein
MIFLFSDNERTPALMLKNCSSIKSITLIVVILGIIILPFISILVAKHSGDYIISKYLTSANFIIISY